MAGDAPGDRRDGADTPEPSREPPATDSIGETEIGRSADERDARDRTLDDDRIPLDLSGGADDDESEADDDDPYAPEPSSTPIERGNPSLENAAFVALGALAMLLVIVRMVAIPL